MNEEPNGVEETHYDPPPEQPEAAVPQPPVVEEPQPTVVNLDVACGNCQRGYSFPVESHVNGFTFTCGACGAKNRWSRQ